MVMKSTQNAAQMEEVFERVSDYFAILSEPMRLKILYELCNGERPVADIVTRIGSTQANISRHLNLLYRAGVLVRRKEGTQVYYGIGDQKTLSLCQTVCSEVQADVERYAAVQPRKGK